jgi:hypothetical protein
MLATYYGSLSSLADPAYGLASPAVAVGTAVDALNGAAALPATAGVFGVRYRFPHPPVSRVLLLPCDRRRYSGFVKSTISGLVTWAFASDGSSRVQVRGGGGSCWC